MTTRTVTNGEIELVVERLGPDDGEPMLLIMGTAGQLIDWPDGFCEKLAAEGFSVARFDNRDSGQSTHLTEAGTPNQLTMLLRPARAARYTLDDMADDALAVMDGLGWSSAHLVGISQGGMIAQQIATSAPGRVRTLTSISSAPGARVGQPGIRALMRIIKVANPRRVKTREDLGQYVVDLDRVAGSPAYPRAEEELREHGRRSFDRGGIDLASVQRQTAAIAASGDRREQLAAVKAPTLVVHGEEDRLILPEAGRATAEAIPGARLVMIPGMGHNLPPELWPDIVADIAALARPAGQPKPATS